MNAFDFLFQYSRNLDKNFILGPKEEVSFKQLYQRCLKIAEYLRSTIGENKNVVLISSNSLFFITAYLAVLKSGNICVPINPAIEQATLDFILNTIDCNCVFLSSKISLNLNISQPVIIREPDLHNILMIQRPVREAVRQPDFDSDRTAGIIFTSGTTDYPKGVVLSHKNISSNTSSIVQYLNLRSSDSVAVVLPFYYCYGLSLLHTHLRVGGALVLNNSFIFLGSVINDLKKYRCTGFAGVPSHFQILLRKSQTFSKTEFPDLRYVTQAGGRLHDVFIEEFVEAFPAVQFYVMYGQTEATARLAYLEPSYLRSKLGSIGKEIPGVSLKILNDRGFPVSIGETGELVAKGDNVMTGYYNDPEATSQALKGGWLYTGDLAKYDDEGFIYLVGRKKEIIKVGGRRVSPKEIEGVILTLSEVIDCTVEGIYDEILGEAISATVVLSEGFDPCEVKVRILNTCYENLSLFKIPQVINFESTIKVNSAGKKIKQSKINS